MNTTNAAAVALLAQFTAEVAPALRAEKLAKLAEAEAIAARKKTATNEELEAGARMDDRRISGYDFVRANEGQLPQRSHFVEKVGGGRRDFVHLPENDKIHDELIKACGEAVITPEEQSRFNAATRACYNALKGRQAKASRDANAGERAKDAEAAKAFTVGEAVQVHAFGHWYKGTVKSINKNGRIVAEYTSGTGVTREKTCSAGLIRKA